MNDSTPVDVVDGHIHDRQLKEGTHVYDFHAGDVLDDLERGGVMIAHEMPNTNPPLTTYLEIKTRIFALKGKPNFGGLYFCYNGLNIDELKLCLADPEVRPYVVGVKIYPASKEGGSVTTNYGALQDLYEFSLEDGSQLDQIARFCAENGLPLTIHCEDPEEKAAILAKKEYGAYDDQTEPHFVGNKAIPLSEKYPTLKFRVAHVSHKDTLGLLKGAWRRGVRNIIAEFTPHHSLLSTEEILERLGQEDAVLGFCHPFVKIGLEHRVALQETLLDGEFQDQIEYSSDHAPHSEPAKREKKFGGVPNHQGPQIMAAWFRAKGIPLSDPRVQKFFSGNAQKSFQSISGWTERFRQRAGSIIFTPADYEEGMSIPDRIHKDVVVNPWGRLIDDDIKSHWVEPRYRT